MSSQQPRQQSSRQRRNHFARPKNTAVRREIRERVIERDGGRCQICGEPIDFDAKPNQGLAPALDHIVPFSEGGAFRAANLRLVHVDCHRRHHDHV